MPELAPVCLPILMAISKLSNEQSLTSGTEPKNDMKVEENGVEFNNKAPWLICRSKRTSIVAVTKETAPVCWFRKWSLII